MGCIQRTGSADRAPMFSGNDGIPRWSEKYASEFDEGLCTELSAFIRRYAHIQGHNDRHYGRKPTPCLFHPDFLEGWPYSLWHSIYAGGS